MTTHYTISLKDYPELVLCYGSTPSNSLEFNDPTVAKVVKFTSMKHAQNCIQLHFPGLPSELFTYTPQSDYKWELTYTLPKLENRAVVDFVKYVLQNDGSLAPWDGSTDSRKFNSYTDAYVYMKGRGILMSCFAIAPTTDDF
jgi:hypothetical protein